jgi:hypothetical protein
MQSPPLWHGFDAHSPPFDLCEQTPEAPLLSDDDDDSDDELVKRSCPLNDTPRIQPTKLNSDTSPTRLRIVDMLLTPPTATVDQTGNSSLLHRRQQ